MEAALGTAQPLKYIDYWGSDGLVQEGLADLGLTGVDLGLTLVGLWLTGADWWLTCGGLGLIWG